MIVERPGSADADPGRRDGRVVAVTALVGASPAEIGALRDRRPHRRHLAAALLDLAARGDLVVEDAGNDPEIGEALDWFLLPGPGSAAAGGHAVLRAHEQVVLGLVAATPRLLLSQLRAAGGADVVSASARADVVARGWRRPGRWSWRTGAGRAVLAEVEATRAALVAERPSPDATAALLPHAVAVGLGDLWSARLGQQRPPPPGWFHPGPSRTARGWLGITALVAAAGAPTPAGGGAGQALGSGYPGGW